MMVFADPLPFVEAPQTLTRLASAPGARTSDADAAADPQFAVIRRREDFDALEDEWSALYQRAGARTQPFQSFNFNWHWCNHYLGAAGGAPNSSLAIVTVRQAGRLVMVWPLVINRFAGLKQLGWMGDPVSQYGDVLADARCDRADLLARSWDFIAARISADFICLRKVRSDSAVAPLMERIDAAVTQRVEAVSHDLGTIKDMDSYLKRQGTKVRKNRRRQRRRLMERGPLAFKCHAGTQKAREASLAAIAMKRTWLAEKGLVSRALSDNRFDDFFAAVAGSTEHDCGCTVSTLTSAGGIAASDISFDAKGRRCVHVLAYSVEFERCGAGAQHMQESIARALADGVQTFDMMAPKASYKCEWGDDITPVCDYAIGLSAPGRIYVWIYLRHLRERAKRAVEKLPPRLRCMFNR